MSNTKFTKGEWEIKKSPFEVINIDHKNYLPYEISSGCQIIAAFYELDADTYLMASAHDMYKELELHVAAWENMYPSDVSDVDDMHMAEFEAIHKFIAGTKDLLAKARGES